MHWLEWISQPWPWYVAGPLITVCMISLLLIGRKFGVSSTFRTACALGGAGKNCEYFRMDWRKDSWGFMLLAGAVLGGVLGAFVLYNPEPIALNPKTVAELTELGFDAPHDALLPDRLFGLGALSTAGGWAALLIGGFLVGFGARWADGCTSGHAISGLSNLQWPSLLAVIGFFTGGLIMTHLLFPLLFS